MESRDADGLPFLFRVLRAVCLRHANRRWAGALSRVVVPKPRDALADARDHALACDASVPCHGPLIYSGNSGDTAFHWIQIGWLLVAAVVLSTIWTVVDRGRPHYARPREMDSSVRAFRARRSDVLLRNGQGHSHAVSRSIARDAGGTGRQSLANRHAMDRDRLVCRLSDVHGLGGGRGRRPSRRPADGDAGCHDRPGRHGSGVRR